MGKLLKICDKHWKIYGFELSADCDNCVCCIIEQLQKEKKDLIDKSFDFLKWLQQFKVREIKLKKEIHDLKLLLKKKVSVVKH